MRLTNLLISALERDDMEDVLEMCLEGENISEYILRAIQCEQLIQQNEYETDQLGPEEYRKGGII